MIKQNKGKDLHKVPKSKLTDGPYLMSKKYDGHYVQIHYDGKDVQMFTSGGKPFYLSNFAFAIKTYIREPFIIECEYNYSCYGLLGDRGKSAILTTYRTNYSKGIVSYGDQLLDVFRVFDALHLPDKTFDERSKWITKLFYGLPYFTVPLQEYVYSIEDAQSIVKEWVNTGYEGAMLKNIQHIYQPGKRTNDIIKLKPRKTADLLCIATKPGTGKYQGKAGSLLLRDSEGREVWAGSGLSDSDRERSSRYFIGTVYEIEYERIDDTYIQPIIKYRRGDKPPSDID